MYRRISQKGGMIDCNIQARKVKIRTIWPQSKIGINIGIILGSYWDHIGIIMGSYWIKPLDHTKL
jgi:Na+/H+-dicarboxylate symporter